MEFLSGLVITDIEDVFTVTAAKGRHMRIINRSSYGLSFCASGKITYTKDGKKTVSTPENAVILPMGASYELYNNSGGEFPVINFLSQKPFTEDFISIPISSFKVYKGDFEKLKALQLFPDSRLKALGVFYELLDRLNGENRLHGDLLDGVIEHINSCFCDPEINNTALAEKANISEVYLRRIFKKKYHTSPKQYILEKRIKLAKQLLTESGKTVSETAFECGFSSLYHFCRIFKEKSGLTPMEYRSIYKL